MRKLLLAICIIIGMQGVTLTTNSYSEEFSYDFNGVIYEQPSYFNINDDNLINPNNEIFEFSEWSNRFYGRLNLNLYYSKVKFISQTRPTYILKEDDEDIEFITDDMYLDVGIGEGYYVYIGKRNLRDVVAYASNPTDFLGENKKVDFTKREEERRVERKGNYVIGAEVFLKNITFNATYAPELDDDWDDWQDEKDRVHVRGNLFAESINTDMSLHLFEGEIPGVGFDLSTTVSDNLVLHTENAARWGSEKNEITVINAGSATVPRVFEIADPDDDEDVYPHIVVGGSYTFGDGTNMILEYIHNGDGYNSREWDEFTEFVKYNNEAVKSEDPNFIGSGTGNLAKANEILKFREMRKNYVFVRISNSTLLENVDSQLVFMVNADDLSFLTFPSIDYKAGENLVVGLSSTIFAGENDAEFGMSYWHNDITITLKYYF